MIVTSSVWGVFLFNAGTVLGNTAAIVAGFLFLCPLIAVAFSGLRG
jgi:hypothetical protein